MQFQNVQTYFITYYTVPNCTASTVYYLVYKNPLSTSTDNVHPIQYSEVLFETGILYCHIFSKK